MADFHRYSLTLFFSLALPICSSGQTTEGFNTSGLSNGEMITNIYLGNFDKIPFSTEDIEINALVYQYMLAYGTTCKSNLPVDKVEMEEMKCKREEIITDGLGYTTTNCLEYYWDGIGIYAKPDLYNVYKVLIKIKGRNAVGELFGAFTNPNTLQNTMTEASNVSSIKSDMPELIRINKCNKNNLDKFEENLIAFVKKDASVFFNEADSSSVSNLKVDYTKEHNMTMFINDLLLVESKIWLSGYYPESIKDVKVVSRDSQNRPEKITAKYNFDIIVGKATYTVNMLLENGIPNCLKFPTFGGSCKTPNYKVIEDLANGKYVVN